MTGNTIPKAMATSVCTINKGALIVSNDPKTYKDDGGGEIEQRDNITLLGLDLGELCGNCPFLEIFLTPSGCTSQKGRLQYQ